MNRSGISFRGIHCSETALSDFPCEPRLDFSLDSHRDQRRVPNGCQGNLHRRYHQDNENRNKDDPCRADKSETFSWRTRAGILAKRSRLKSPITAVLEETPARSADVLVVGAFDGASRRRYRKQPFRLPEL